MSTYTVKKGEWLAKIAEDHGFRDGGAAIWDADPELQKKAGGNQDVLPEGLEIQIPDLIVKTVKVAAGRTARVRVRTCSLGVRVMLIDQDGKKVSGWKFIAKAAGMADLKGESSSSGEITIPKLPPGTKTVTLEVQDSSLFDQWKFASEKIVLHVGELDPVMGDPGFATMAVKKLLVNQGHHPGPMNADATPEFHAAVASFQAGAGLHPPHGLADQKTCEALVQKSNVRISKTAAPEKTPAPNRSSPLTNAKAGGSKNESVTAFSKYVDPTDPDQTNEKMLKRFHFFPTEAYVAPSDPENNRWNTNVLRMPSRKFIFLDAGRWIGDGGARDFGLLWGRHVYLCRYHRKKDPAREIVFKRTLGLDREFFASLEGHIEILNYTSASWASSQDFDWDHVVVVIPDLHLMTKPTADVWFDMNYKFGAENDLLLFAEQLLNFDGASGKLRVVQIGDSYDLWVNCRPCLFKPNETLTVELVDPEAETIQQLLAWMRLIQEAGADSTHKFGPAMRAMEMLEAELGGDRGIIYLYGNHDNYLGLDQVTAAAGIPKRRKYWECPGVFIEHGHRMEARFQGPVNLAPLNHDGAESGYKATVDTYEDMRTGGKFAKKVGSLLKKGADKGAGWFQQPQYWGEQAQVWLGRQTAGGTPKPAHICVIGHTHMPLLNTINIEAYRTAL